MFPLNLPFAISRHSNKTAKPLIVVMTASLKLASWSLIISLMLFFERSKIGSYVGDQENISKD
jgi:hypothetical protein